MAGICYHKGYERGLYFERQCIEETIKLKQSLKKDTEFEKKLLRSYKKFSERDYALREKL